MKSPGIGILAAFAIAGNHQMNLRNAVTEQKLYPFLVDGDGRWKSRKDVYHVHQEITQPDQKNKTVDIMGVENGLGHILGNAHAGPVKLLKS